MSNSLLNPSGINFRANQSMQKMARVVGILFLLSLIIPILNWVCILSKFSLENYFHATQSIIAHEFLFRLNITMELITSIVIILFALLLYRLLEWKNKNIALIALFLKFTEAILTAVIALAHYIALLFLKGQIASTEIEGGQLQELVGLFINVHIPLTAILGIFSGLGLMLFSYLLLKSKYIPGILALMGILSYTLVFMYDTLTILSPNYAAILIIQIICTAPICLFQITCGLWLLIKGVNIEK